MRIDNGALRISVGRITISFTKNEKNNVQLKIFSRKPVAPLHGAFGEVRKVVAPLREAFGGVRKVVAPLHGAFGGVRKPLAPVQ